MKYKLTYERGNGEYTIRGESTAPNMKELVGVVIADGGLVGTHTDNEPCATSWIPLHRIVMIEEPR